MLEGKILKSIGTFNKTNRTHFTLMSLKLKVILQYLQLSVLASHSLSLCLSFSERRTVALQASQVILSNSQRPSC